MESIIVDLKERIEEHKNKVERKTLSIKEFAEAMGISYNQANKLSHTKGAPVILLGRTRRIIISKLDLWLESFIGADID